MINLALVGCGGMAHSHAQSLLGMKDDVNVVALVDVLPDRTKAYKEKYFPKATEFDSYEKLMAAPPAGLTGVVLVTPHYLHYGQSKAALEKGLHVLCEKPLVTNSKDAYDLWATVKKTGKLLAIGFQASYTAEYQAIKAYRDNGKLGRVQIISGWLAQGWLKNTANSWRQDPKQSGGGQMYDSGSHVLNGMMWLMNEPVVEVSCMYDTMGSPVDINGVAILRFEGGALGSVAIGGNSAGWDVAINIQTDIGQVRTGPHGGFLEMKQHGRTIYPAVSFDDTPGAFTVHRNFIRAIQGKEALEAPVRYGVLLSSLMDAMYESAAKQAPVKVKPVPKEI